MDIEDIIMCKSCYTYLNKKTNELVSLETLKENNIDIDKIRSNYCKSCLRYVNWENETYKF